MAQLLMPFSNTEKTQIIRKSNELIEARYKLSIAEQRLVMLLASEISPDDEDFKSYEIRVSDFAKMFGLEKCNSMYSEVQKAAKELVGKRLDLSKNGKEIYTTWLSYVEYVDGSGVVNLEFHASLKPYFLQLKGYYTQYKLHHVMSFKSQYSMRLYELLKMDAFKVSKNGQFEKSFELQEYRDLLGIEKKAYSIFADFRKNVVQPLVSEISDKTDLFIADVKYGKTGRKITNITFCVEIRTEQETKLRQANLRIGDIKPEKESHAIIDKLVSLGFPLEIAEKFKKKYPVGVIERNIAYTLAKKVDNIPAYLNMAIESDYAGAAWEAENKKKEEAKKEQAKLAKEAKEKVIKEKQEEKSRSEALEKILADFDGLPETEKKKILDDFIESKKDIYALGNAMKKIYAEYGLDSYKNKTFKDNFVVFLSGIKTGK
jgi:plasmid replication initiation protein